MDSRSYERYLRRLRLAPESRVQYFDSREGNISNEYLNDQELEAKMPNIISAVDDSAQRSPGSLTGNPSPPFILMQAQNCSLSASNISA
ncbi:hypothetical protein BU26DRAFT_522511, partial [Trematosphaeria pertusa]